MSHYAVLVIGENLDSQLEPYSEDIEVERYSTGLVSEDEKQKMMNFYKGKGQFETFDECYAQFGDDWNYGRYEKNEDGEWEEFSTYNPDSKWDWWVIGGRWSGFLKLKEGSNPLEPLTFDFGWSDERKERLIKENRANVAYKKDIENLSQLFPFAIVQDGEWYERGRCGWWGIITEDKGEEKWKEEVRKLLEGLPDDELLTIVDCHI